MSIAKKGKSFNGGKKNRNKILTREERKLKYTKKISKKSYDVNIVDRENLECKHKKTVSVSAELKVFIHKDPLAPSLLEHVYVDNEYVDHVWVKFPVKERKKLKYAYKGCRILFTATVIKYSKVKDRQIDEKYGLIDIKLLDN